MSDPNYHSIDTDTSIGGQVRRGGIGLMRPFAVVAAIAGVGVVLYFLLAGGEEVPTIDATPREEFRPVQTPRNEGFRTPHHRRCLRSRFRKRHHRRHRPRPCGCPPPPLSRLLPRSIAPEAKTRTTPNALSWSERPSCWNASARLQWYSISRTRPEERPRCRPMHQRVCSVRTATLVNQAPRAEMPSIAIVPS